MSTPTKPLLILALVAIVILFPLMTFVLLRFLSLPSAS